MPITFIERRHGASKLRARVLLESAILPWQLALSSRPAVDREAASGTDARIRDLSGNPLDLQPTGGELHENVVIAFDLDTRRLPSGLPVFPDNLAITVARRFADVDEDEQPSYDRAEDVQMVGATAQNPNAYALPDVFGAANYLPDGTLAARPTARVSKVVDDLNQVPPPPAMAIPRELSLGGPYLKLLIERVRLIDGRCDAVAGGATWHIAGIDAFDRGKRGSLPGKSGMERRPFRFGEIHERFALVDACPHQLADDFVRFAERHSIASQQVRGIGCQGKVANRGFGQSKVTLLTPRSMRIETQGISGNLPFNYQLHARRVGDCGR